MDGNFGLKSNTNLTFIEFDDQQKVKIGTALQAVADQMVPKLDRQLNCNYEVEEGSSCVENIERKVETLIPSANMDTTCVSSLRNSDEVVVKTEISNQVLLESSNDLSSYLVKEEPQLQKFEVDPPAPNNETSAWSEDMYCSQEIEPINMQYNSDEGSGLSKDCGSEIIVGDESIDSIESNSQDEGDKQNVEQKMISFIHHICPECGVDCGPYSKWKEHTETQHTITWLSFISKIILDGESCYQCLKCKKKLNKKSAFRLLQEHHIKHLPHSSYLKCHFCDKRFQALSYVLHHIKRKHANLIGPALNNKYSNPNFRYIKIFCPICQESQLNVRLWQQHLTERHDYENKIKSGVTEIDKDTHMYSCNLCQKKSRCNYIKIHMLSHLPHKSFQCILCKKTDTYLQGAVSHISRKHYCNIQNKLFECSFCKATFAKESLLENHQSSHKKNISKNMGKNYCSPTNQDETDVESEMSNSVNQLDSNQLQLRTPNNFSTHNNPTKEEPQLQKIEIDETEDSNKIKSINIQKKCDGESGISNSINQLHSNQLQLRTPNDLSTYNTLIKAEPDLQKLESEHPARLVETRVLSYSNEIESIKVEPQPQKFEIEHAACLNETEDLSHSNEIGSKNMQKISSEESGLTKNVTNEKDDKNIYIREIDSQVEDDDDQNIEQETASYDYKSVIHYICPECGIDCGPYSQWKLHTETQHIIDWLKFISKTNVDGESCYQCLECNIKLSRKVNFTLLQEHHIKHMLHNHYLKCGSCDKRFRLRCAIYSHIKREHSKLDLKKKPSNTNIQYIKIFCPFCEEPQTDIKQWRQHLTEKHDYENKAKSQAIQVCESSYSCQLCQRKIQENHIKNHMLIHESKKSFQCTLCKKYETLLTAAIQHINRKHSAALKKN